MTNREWADLSNDEVRARLKQRGVLPHDIAVAVAYRDNEKTRWPDFISTVLAT